MERRLGRVLDMQLVEAYLKLDEDQLTSKKVGNTFSKVLLSARFIDHRQNPLRTRTQPNSSYN